MMSKKGVIDMKKVFAVVFAVFIGACVLILGNNSADASIKVSPGVYQCAVCGIIVNVGNGTVLDETSFYDGHRHDWRYIGSGKGTIHPVK